MAGLSGNRSRAVTIYDVAKQAGVSTATVSRVINQTSFVTKETRERVEEAIAYLGYVPSATARKLSAGRSTSIALLISNLSNPFSAEVAEGVRSFFSEKEIGLVLGSIRADPDTELSQLELVLAQGVVVENLEEVVDYLRSKEKLKVGLLNLSMYRPFPGPRLVQLLKGKKAVTILERTDPATAENPPLMSEVRAALDKAVENGTCKKSEKTSS